MHLVTALEDRLYMDIGQTIGNDINKRLFTIIINNIIYNRATILCSLVNVHYYIQGTITLLVHLYN